MFIIQLIFIVIGGVSYRFKSVEWLCSEDLKKRLFVVLDCFHWQMKRKRCLWEGNWLKLWDRKRRQEVFQVVNVVEV